jgi:ribokinase
MPFEIVFKSFQLAKTKKMLTILNPAPATVDNETIYQNLDYLVLNETEAERLTKIKLVLDDQINYAQISDYFLNLGVQNVILTLGAQGSYFKNKTIEHFEPALKIKVVNTTGAGDAYLGALISQIIQEKSIEQAMQFATKIAAEVCQHYETQVELTTK